MEGGEEDKRQCKGFSLFSMYKWCNIVDSRYMTEQCHHDIMT